MFMKDQLGVITEIGDLGLGFDPISEEDEKAIKERLEEDK